VEGLLAAETTYRTMFDALGVASQPGVYGEYTEVIRGESEILDARFVSNIPQMRKWTGARIEKFVRTHQLAARTETYEATMKLQRRTVQYADKNLGLISSTIRNYLEGAKGAYDKACVTEFTAASNLGNTCFDSSALFSATHPYGNAGATWSNLAAGTNYGWVAQDAGRQAMREFTLENGEPAGMNATHLLVGPKLERKAKEVNEAKERIVLLGPTGSETTTDAPGVNTSNPFTNVWQGELKVIVDTRITDYTWTLMDLSKPGVRPIFLYETMAPMPQILDQLNSEGAYETDQFTYGLLADFVAFPGHPICCYRGTGTAVGT
jgi:phage major head subunit gpT-like protein